MLGFFQAAEFVSYQRGVLRLRKSYVKGGRMQHKFEEYTLQESEPGQLQVFELVPANRATRQAVRNLVAENVGTETAQAIAG